MRKIVFISALTFCAMLYASEKKSVSVDRESNGMTNVENVLLLSEIIPPHKPPVPLPPLLSDGNLDV